MYKIHSRQQILEAIKYWKNVLKKMDESKNQLLDVLFKAFNTDNLLKPFNGNIDNRLLAKCFNILNRHFFSSKLKKIPLIYESDAKIRKFLVDRETNPNTIPKLFFGVYSVICDNDKIEKWSDELILHDDVILLNSSYIDSKSISFLIACLCHEMIHYYDRLFGEYCDFTNFE